MFKRQVAVLCVALAYVLFAPADAEAGVRGKIYRDQYNPPAADTFEFRTDGTFRYAFLGFGGGVLIEGYYVEVDLILVSYVLAIGTERKFPTNETQTRILTGVSYLGLTFFPYGEGFIGNGKTYTYVAPP